jgi:hypothetical protein
MVKPQSAKTESITFLAAFPDIQGQLKVGRDGMRIALDVPESELSKALLLVLWRDKVLRVTVQVEQSLAYGKSQAQQGTKASPLDVAGS